MLKNTNGQQAFAVVYQRHFALVYHYARKLLDNTQEAEDIASESFVKLWESFAGFNSVTAVRSFLLTVTKNACLNLIKRNKRAQEREVVFSAVQEPAANAIENEAVAASIYQYIFDEIEKLPFREREVFVLSYLDGKSNEEIAVLLAINNQSVRNYKARALKSLRSVFSNKEVFTVFMMLIGLSRS